MFPLWIDDVIYTCSNVFGVAMLLSREIPVSHQCDIVTMDIDDAMYDVSAIINPGQNDVSLVRDCRWNQKDILLTSNDKWQHAVAICPERYFLSFL